MKSQITFLARAGKCGARGIMGLLDTRGGQGCLRGSDQQSLIRKQTRKTQETEPAAGAAKPIASGNQIVGVEVLHGFDLIVFHSRDGFLVTEVTFAPRHSITPLYDSSFHINKLIGAHQ